LKHILDIYLADIYLSDNMVEIKTSTVESLLGVLSLGPMSGYEIRQFMKRSTANFWSESYGQIYPALKAMLAYGLIATVKGNGEGGPGKKVYRITGVGEQRLREWLSVPVQPQKNRNELLLKVFFGSKAEKGAIAAQVRLWREHYLADVERYEELRRCIPERQKGHEGLPFFLATLRYGIAEAKAVIGWCDETLAELERKKAVVRG
jgi:PadR family transcriptional regulator, regulatory protein AphA